MRYKDFGNSVVSVLPIGSFGIVSPTATINDFFRKSYKGSLKPSYLLALPGSAIVFDSVSSLSSGRCISERKNLTGATKADNDEHFNDNYSAICIITTQIVSV